MDYSQITDYLSIMASPVDADAATLLDNNVKLVLAMNHKVPPGALRTAPLALLHLPTSDSPFLPIPMAKLQTGVEAALPVIDAGGGVMVYCNRGRHRSVTMAAAILIAKGYTADEAMALIKHRRPAADPGIWYIKSRIRKFERDWRAKHPNGG